MKNLKELIEAAKLLDLDIQVKKGQLDGLYELIQSQMVSTEQQKIQTEHNVTATVYDQTTVEWNEAKLIRLFDHSELDICMPRKAASPVLRRMIEEKHPLWVKIKRAGHWNTVTLLRID